MPKLPNIEGAILDIRKITDYCLSPEHPRGRHKARVFRDALELKRDDAEWLRTALLGGLRHGEARRPRCQGTTSGTAGASTCR